MLSKCANPVCSAKLHYLNEGKIFRVEADVRGLPGPRKPVQRSHDVARVAPAPKPESVVELVRDGTRRAEYFWLCGLCAREMTVIVQEQQVMVIPVRQFAMTQAAAS